jgi:collagen type III alpha
MSTQNDQTRAGTNVAPPLPAPSRGRLVEYDEFIEAQLRKTRGQVRMVDLAGALMTLMAGGLLFLLAAALVDHWVVRGGMAPWARWAALTLFVVSGAAYLVVGVVPSLVRRINPLYAAEAIERSRPTLKNALVNFLFLRASSVALPPRVFEAVEEQAATNLARVQVDATIDRTRLVRTAYALAGVLLVAALYTMISPKNLLQTAGRIVMPWAEIDAPTRTTIVDIVPGDVQAFRGQQVAISARVQNLPANAKVTLLYSTADGQTVDRAVDMVLADDGYKHAATLPAGDGALQQNLAYRVEAGDAISRRFQVRVVSAPAITVQSVTYRYPKYTNLLEQRVERQGDIRAIEGTEVLIEALANQDIDTAAIDFDCDATHDRPMLVSQREAKVNFRLALRPDRQAPDHATYQLLFKNQEGQVNPQPVRHQIEVTPDLPPEVQIVGPKQDDMELPADGTTQIEIVANDPDFALRTVKLSATSRDKAIVDEVLSSEEHQGQLVRKFRLEPRKLGLKSGDVVDYWAVAEDNKQPRANQTVTPKRRFRIVSPSASRRPVDEVARRERPGDGGRQPDANDKGTGGSGGKRDAANEPAAKRDRAAEETPGQAAEREGGQPQPRNAADEQQPSESATGESAGKPRDGQQGSTPQPANQSSVPSDGTDDGDAIERILKHREEHQQDKPPERSREKNGEPTRDGNSDGKQGRDTQPSQGQESGEQPGGDSDGDKQAAGKPNAGGQGDQAGGKNPSGKDKQQQQDRQRGGADSNNQSDRGEAAKDREPSSPQAGDQQQPTDKADRNQQKPDSSQGKSAQQGSSGPDESSSADRNRSDTGSGAKRESAQGQQSKAQQGQGEQGTGQQGKGGAGQDQQGTNPSGQDQTSKGPQGKGQAGQGTDGKGEEQAGQSGADKKGRESSGPSTGEHGSQEDADGEPNGQGGDAQSRKSPNDTKPGKSDKHGTPGSETKGFDESNQAQPGESRDSTKSAPRGDGDDRQRAETKSERKPGGPEEKGADREPKRPGDAQDNATSDEATSRQPTEGQGGQSKSDPTGQKPPSRASDAQKPDAAGGDGEHDKGNSGAGHATSDTKGSPNPKQTAQPTKKAPKTSKDDNDPRHEDPGQAASQSSRESSTESEEDGEQSGGGKRGGGQKANKPGTGGPGQNTAADEGAGVADEAGRGETSDRAGQDREADKATGQSGSKRGKGSSTRPTDGEMPGGGGESKELGSHSSGESLPSGEPGEGSESTGPPQGGKPGGAPAEQVWKPGTDAADEANLEFARQATELALAHLKDELKKERPDPALLDRLGWTAKDLENFVKRWEQMHSQAKSGGETGLAARKELDDTLRSLGLRPRGTNLKSNAARDDQARGLKESRRTRPPAEYAEQSKAYSQGTARGEQ